MVDFTRLTQHAVSLRRWILISAILFSVAVSNGDTQLQSKSFTGQQATTNRNSFNFRTFGNVSSLEHCVDFCCRDETCELAIFSRGFHCFGVSCSEPKLCHKILDRLLMEDERELQRSSTITGTKDFIRHTSQVANPRCPQRFVPSFHVLLLGTSTPRAFHKLHVQSIDASQCSAQCFRSRGCFLSFIEDNECYGVTGHDAGANGTKRVQEPSIGLEVAIIDRNKEVSRSLDDDDEDPDELGSDDVDNGAPASKQEVASLQSQSKLQQTVNELPATKMQKKRQTSRNSKVSFASTNSTNGRNNDKFTKKKHTSRLTKEAKIRSVSLAHLSTKSNVLYPNVIHLKLSNEKGIMRQSITLPPTKSIFSHLTTKNIALSPNLTVKHASENSGVVPEGSNRVRSTKNLFSEEMNEGRSEDYNSSTNRNEEDFSGDDELSGGGDSSGDRHPSGAVKDSSKSDEDVSGEDDGWGGADNDLSSGSKDISRYSDLSGDSSLSGDKHTSGPIKDSSKNDKDVSGEDEGWSEGDDDLSGGRKNISGGDDDDDDDDVSGDEDLSGDRHTSGVVKDLSKSDNDVSGEGEDWGEANNDLSGDGKDKSGNDEHFSGDFHSTERTSYNEIQHKKTAWKDKSLRNTTKTVNADYPGSGDKENGKRKGDHHLIQKKTFVRKKIEKRKEIDLKGLDDLGSDNDDSEKKSRKVVNFPQETSDSQAAKNGKKTVTERVKSKKGGNSRKESYHVEDPDDLGSDDGGNERTSKKAANLIKKTSISKATKKGKKSDNNNLKSKKTGDTRKNVRLVKDLGDVGSDDNDSDRTSKTVGNLHPKTNISNTIMTEKKEDNKHLKSNKVVNTRKKIDLVENLEDLASDNDENVKNKLRKNSKVAPRKDVRLPQKINSEKSTFSNAIKNGKKKDNGYRKPNREGKTKQIDLVEDLNYLGSNDDDSVKTKGEQRTSRKNASLTPRTNNVTENNNSKVYNEQLKSSSGKTHSKPRDKNTKKAFSNSVKVIGRPLDSANKLPSVSTIQSWTNHSGFKNHFVNHKATPLGTTLVRDSANLQNESGPITEHGIKKGETKQHIARNGERTTKHEDTLKQATVRNSTSTKEKYTQQSGMKESIRPSLNITDAVDKSTESDQSNRIGHHSQTISRKPKKTAKVPPSSDKAKVTSNTRPHNALLKTKASVTRNSKAMTQETQRRSSTSVKGHFTRTKHLKSTPEASTKKSIFKDKNIKNKLTKLMKSSKVQGNDSLQTKETAEKRKTKSSTSPSRFAGIDDLMKYAHRKDSEKRQPFLNHQVERFVPATKQAMSGKTTPQRQSHKKTATNRNKTMQGQRPMTVRPTASTIFDSLKKDKAMPKKRPNIHHLPSADKLAIKNLQKLTSSVSGLGTRDQASSKDNRSFPFLPTLSPNVHPKIKEKNTSLRDQGTSKKTHLLLKQRSNEHAFGKKKEFLSHFHKDVNGSDGVDFSVKSNGNRHKEKHSKQDLSLDLEDLGDADFDIMMSNDIPHKDLPKKEKGKERGHKHTDKTKEKQRDTKSDSIGKKKNKNKNDKKKKGGKEDGEESQKNTETHHTSHRHKEKMSDVSGRKHHHNHHKESDHGTDNDDDEAHASNNAGKSSNYDKKSHHRSKHGKSSDPVDNDSESRYRRKKHRHQAKTIYDNGNDDDNNSVKSDNEKRRFHKHKEKNQHKAKNNDESVDDEKMQHHYHHSHKTHKKKYDNNDWVGKIIPGKVKLTYEDDDDKKRHHHGQHKVRDDKKTNHHKRKHSLVADENPEDISKETEGRKSHRHSNDKHYVEGDDYNKHEKHATHHKNVEDDSEINRNAKHRDNEMKKDNEEKQEHAEKKTDVNYEAIEVGRHRFVYHEDEESHHHEEEDKDNHQRDDDSDDDDGDNSSERKTHDKDDDRDESEKSDDDNDEDAKGNSGGNDKKEDYPSKETKKNRVVLGEDSENDDKDEEKDSEESERGHHGNEHENERNNDEREDDQYHDEHHKPSLHNRRKHYRHWKSKHGHHESDYQSKEADNDSDHHNEGDGQVDKRKRNFRKSFIYHKKKAEEQRSRDHYDTERDGEEQLDHDVNSEYKNENHDREFNVDRHHPHPSRHHRHHHLRPLIEKQRKENYEDLYEPDDVKYHHERQHDEQVNFRRHHHLKDNYRIFQREKEGRHDVYISHEDDEKRWKFNQEQHDGDFDETSHQRDDQDSYVHRFIGEDKPSDYYHQEDNKRRKFKPWHKRWKKRHYYHNNEEQNYEDSGGFFDSSSWIPNDSYDDNDFYGGEGNHERKKHPKKHRKYKNRKDRQSYEYWAYGNQNPYYYDYKYHKYRSRYENYPPQPSPHYDWHNRYRGGYGQWKPKPKHWYADSQQWDMAGSWRHPPKLRQFHEYRPTGYRWNKFYDNNDDHQFSNQPKPTLYPTVPFLRPTNPRWQRPDATQKGFRGDNLPPAQNRAPSKHYQDWSENGQGVATYGPQQHSPSGFQPQLNPDTVKPGDQPQPVGVQSKYVPPASQQEPDRIDNKTRFHPTVRRQYSATPPAKVLSPPSSIAHIKNIMDSLNAPFPSTEGQHPGSVPSNVQNETNIKNGLNISRNEQNQDSKRLNGFFKEESAGKKSDILRPMNRSKEQPTNNASGNAPHHAQQIPLKTTSNPANVPTQPTHVTNKTTVVYTFQIHTTRNQTTRKPSQTAQNSSTTAVPTHKSTAELTSPAPNFGDVSQSDESSETGKKHRKHRAPVCLAGKTTDDVTLLRGKKAGNFTNVGDVGDFGMCIKRCCQKQKCDLAFKSAETCFLVSCFSQESCQTSPSLDDIFSPRICFVKRHLQDNDKDLPGKDDDDDDDDDGWNDKVSPSGIHEVCEAERALGILWKKTVAGHYSTHPCPRDAKGLVKRRCEADSRWLPPNFSDCVSSDYQVLYDKSKKLASGADPSPLIRELSQLTTQNIDNSLIFGGDLDRATDIMAAIVQHNGQTDFLEMTREDVENFVRASSNLLDMTNQQEWFNIQKNKPGTADVLRSMEMFALQAAMRLPREDMTEPTITNNIVIKLDRKSAGEGGLTFPDFSNPRVDRWDARHDVIALPSSVFDRVSGEDSTASISFKSLPYLLPDSNVSSGLGPNSKVISTVMHPHPQGKITPPVTVVLSHIKRRRGNPKCVFWDYTLNPHRGGAWSSRGCWLAFNNQSHSICQCSHLSNFAVLMDLSSDESLQKEQKRERTMALMWIGIPVLIVGVIGGLYMSFSWNRKSGIPSTVTRPSSSLNEKTGLLGQRVVTSQVREEFPPSPTRDLYRALSPGYSPTGDLEWQDEFDFDVETGDQRFKQMLLPKLQLLQNQLINEFYDADKMETKKMLLQSKSEENTQMEINTQVQCETLDRQTIQMKPTKIQREPAQKRNRQTRSSSGKNLRVRFADERPPGRNLTDEDKERFKRLQRMERRVFAQHLSRWKASSHLNLSE